MHTLKTLRDKTEDHVSVCWLWTASLDKSGYGEVGHEGRVWRAHRLAFTLAYGDIPTDMHVDHTCFNRACINPDHLQLLDPALNRGRTRTKLRKACRSGGHLMEGHNVVIINHKDGTTSRRCRACRRIWERANRR